MSRNAKQLICKNTETSDCQLKITERSACNVRIAKESMILTVTRKKLWEIIVK